MAHVTLHPSQVEQLRRAAKRLRREADITHSEALDRIAAQHGYQNWSVLARHVEDAPSTPPAAVSAQQARAAMHLPRMEATRSEMAAILAIVKRYADLVGDDIVVERLSVMMDLEACHCNGCPLDLIALLEASRDFDLVHDVAGIQRHINRETGQLEDFFRPRYALPERALSA